MKSLEHLQKEIETILIQYLPVAESLENKVGIDAARYSFLNGGKRIRPILMYAAYAMMADEIDETLIHPFMAAIEMIHTYSLIHDDLPAMDNDTLRRGKPTCHIVYGEANGILAGDTLLNYAYETLFKVLQEQSLKAPATDQVVRCIKAASTISYYSGIEGMIAGQISDIAHEGDPNISLDTLLYIDDHKTAALIKACLEVGCILAGGSEEEQEIFSQIGHDLGIAFQIQDDLFDCISTEQILGKPIGSDEKNDKKTYVSFYGQEQSMAEVSKRFGQINQRIESYDPKREALLSKVIDYIQNRNY